MIKLIPNKLIKKYGSIELQRKNIHLKKIGRWPNLSNPELFTEKIFFRLFKTYDPRLSALTDKIQARNYVKDKLGDEVLIPIYGIFDHIKPSDVYACKQSTCVIKCNHDSGSSKIIQTDHENLWECCKNFNEKIKKPYGVETGEYWYSEIQPKILIQEFVSDNEGVNPTEARFHMFNQGNDIFKTVLSIDHIDKEDNSKSVTFYDENFNILPFSNLKYENAFKDIENIQQVKKAHDMAKVLAREFDYVRVDFLILSNKIYFSELTFSHSAGLVQFRPESYNLWLGNLWKQSSTHINRPII